MQPWVQVNRSRRRRPPSRRRGTTPNRPTSCTTTRKPTPTTTSGRSRSTNAASTTPGTGSSPSRVRPAGRTRAPWKSAPGPGSSCSTWYRPGLSHATARMSATSAPGWSPRPPVTRRTWASPWTAGSRTPSPSRIRMRASTWWWGTPSCITSRTWNVRCGRCCGYCDRVDGSCSPASRPGTAM